MKIILQEQEEIHQRGLVTIEKKITKGGIVDLGIKTTRDGRIWICIDGEAFLRFKPMNF